MKFDIIVSNPPYQDGNKKGGQNKLYNYFSRKAINDWSKENGEISFVTPTAVTKKSKRFSLIGMSGLKHINYSAGNYFNVGVNICNWYIDKQYKGKVEIIDSNENTTFEENNEFISDYAKNDRSFVKLYHKIRAMTKDLNSRMFKSNNFGFASKGKLIKQKYKFYKSDNDGKLEFFGYHKRKPYFYNELKINFPLSRTLRDDKIIIGHKNMYYAYVYLNVNSQQEIDNLKSFILSDYYIKHNNKWRKISNNRNYSLIYLPKFDKTKHWTNKEVKQFFENIEKS